MLGLNPQGVAGSGSQTQQSAVAWEAGIQFTQIFLSSLSPLLSLLCSGAEG
jgi:hypothetical protein